MLPTSCEGEFGHIRYTACVVFDIPLWRDKEFEVPFTVIKPIDLNAIPNLRVNICFCFSFLNFTHLNEILYELINLFDDFSNRLLQDKRKHFHRVVYFVAAHRIH